MTSLNFDDIVIYSIFKKEMKRKVLHGFDFCAYYIHTVNL